MSINVRLVSVLAFLLTITVPVALPQDALLQGSYSVVDIGILPAPSGYFGGSCSGRGINNLGDVVGNCAFTRPRGKGTESYR